jgi:N-acetyl-anhydromuramyl-L-alanine amidase AmpD
MPLGLSSLAMPIDNLKAASPRSGGVYGIAVHQTGESIVEEAIKKGVDPLQHAIAYYDSPGAYYAHYVVGHDGTIAQITDEGLKAPHIGFLREDHDAFLDGSWASRLPDALVTRWRARWPDFKSPADLFPGPSPNDVYVGVEMLPLSGDLSSRASWLPTARFTEAQHRAVKALALDIAARWGLPEEWWTGGRLVGHEDVNPLERHTTDPAACWDPGYLRDEPWFDFDWLRMEIINDASIRAAPDGQ